MNGILHLSFVLALVCFLGACSSEGDSPRRLTLFVAASMTDVIQEVGAAFEAESGAKLVYNFAGSGALAQQIIASPRADLFISASERWMDEVQSAGRILEGGRESLLSNSLVVVANRESDYRLDAIEELCSLPFDLLATGDPAFVPAGGYAKQYLSGVACSDGAQSVWQRLEGRISPAPDVRAALSQVIGSEDVIGIVYRTDALARGDDVDTIFEIAPSQGPEILYPIGILRQSQQLELARDFVAFLRSDRARRIFEAAGFIMAQ
ncbi:molybdate ABC transporter substrate-binding protein [Pelagicoccus sp. SDUM812003]|uniref:molybdate ABC transporter substrate-binding protein n=1 Tax=Pelagicoccus sp. SDUM812003 TaxID=3041267 RepID=UPI0028104729|nr:molybdate ABC transporter substrate-binding protein [Pelagicoccus sp. SDUM812003]MDQ8202629.1 molybdate ABC transporter substrate-binding protein [Pelagicoccus sp. SDUM812003]